jgi:hypothetical protein
MVADHVEPLAVPHLPSWPQRIDAVLLEPFLDIKKEVLLAPQHAGQRLTHHIGRIFADPGWRDRPVELVGLTPARLEDLREPRAERFLDAGRDIAQP